MCSSSRSIASAVVKPEAYGLYLKARYAFYEYTSRGWQQAIEHFNRAIETRPAFAPAYSGLADTYLVAGTYGAIPTEEALTRGKAAAAKALELDDSLASAHYALATVAHLVRLGLGGRGTGVSPRTRAQSQ